MDVIEQRSRQESELLAVINEWITRHPEPAQVGDQVKLAVIAVEITAATRLRSYPGGPRGEQLLRELHQRICSTVRPDDRHVVLSDTELLLVLFGIKSAGHARLAVRKLLNEITQYQNSELETVRITPRLGIAVWPDVAANGEELLRTASLAVDRARECGEAFFFYQPKNRDEKLFHWNIEAEIERALKEDELKLHFQPQISTASGCTTGAEALIHWHHPRYGYLSPSSFIPLVENSAVIDPLSRWCLHSALRQLASWMDNLHPPTLSVNISSRNFSDPSFLDMVSNALSVWGIPPNLLTLELTESALLEDIDYAITILQALQRMGIRVSIDDFGTGYSSLAYLKNLPVDELKIDQSFIRNLLTDRSDRNIVETIIKIANDFGFGVVAEGIEQEAIIPLLHELGCETGQGFAISRPLSAEAFGQWLAQHPCAKS
ncbi:MAG: GGDEF domain-containing phosphodiesterase [Gammaproteobacteria bacterium]|nr:GGDEF domain-containing phosphodiesterase [Gammaproteobacteria bacterium]MCW8992168.1 GGDEF domain-containing phosphodiesterase [Gammaproteobacteria bacterium]